MTLGRMLAVMALLAGLAGPAGAAQTVRLLNVSYDATRELYLAYDQLFAAHWREVAG